MTLADICLVPQVSNARRLKVPLDKFPKIVAADAACLKLAGLRQSETGKPAGCRVTAAQSPARPTQPHHPSRPPANATARDQQQTRTRRPLDGRRIALVFGHGRVDSRAGPRRLEHFRDSCDPQRRCACGPACAVGGAAGFARACAAAAHGPQLFPQHRTLRLAICLGAQHSPCCRLPWCSRWNSPCRRGRRCSQSGFCTSA